MSPIPYTFNCSGTLIYLDACITTNSTSSYGTNFSPPNAASNFNYQNNQFFVQTICTSTGQCMTLNPNTVANTWGIYKRDTLWVYDGASTSGTLLGTYTDLSTNPTTTLATSQPCVTFKFKSNSDTTGRGWRFTITCGSCPSSPSNDNYTGASPLTVGSSCTYTTGTTYFANSSVTCASTPTCSAGTPGNADDDVWYTFTTGSTQVSATVQVQSISPMDAVVEVLSGTCGSFSQLSCVNATGAGGLESTGTITVSPNTTYYVRVYDAGSFAGSNNPTNDAFQICVIGGTQNDCAANSEVCSTTQISHTNSGGTGTQEYGTGSWGCLFGEHNSAWYSFKASSSGTLSFNIASNGGSFQDIDWGLWGPFASSSSLCTLTPILSSSYAVSNSNPGCGLPVYSTGLSSCETGGTNCEGAGGNGSVVAFNQPVSIIAGDYYLLLVDIFAGNTSYYINWSLSGGAAFDATYGSGCVVLPISILEFNGEVEGDVNHLYWSTASEENNSYFALERSTDGERFDSIGRVEGAGNSAVQLNYQFLDTHPVNGVNYYRLRQVDNDGQYSYSNIIELENSSSGLSIESVYPNPTNGLTNVDINSNEEATVMLDVFDGLSRVILHNAASVKKGSNTISVDLSNYPAGVYYLNCQSISKKMKVFAKVVKN